MSLRFDNISDLLSRTTNLPTISSFTMMLWGRIDVDRNEWSTFFSFGDSVTINEIYQVATGSDGQTLVLYRGSTSSDSYFLSVGQWYHLTLVVEGTGTNEAHVYVDGVEEITDDGNAAIAAELMEISAFSPASDEWLNGSVAYFKCWDAVLTLDEIKAEMHSALPVRWANLNTYMPCFSTSDQGVDYSGNGYDFTVGGTLATEDGPPIPPIRFDVPRVNPSLSVKAMLMDSTYAFDPDDNSEADLTGELSGGGYAQIEVPGRLIKEDDVADEAQLRTDPVLVFPSLAKAAGVAYSMVFKRHYSTATPSDNTLVGYTYLGGIGGHTPDGNDFRIKMPTGGWFSYDTSASGSRMYNRGLRYHHSDRNYDEETYEARLVTSSYTFDAEHNTTTDLTDELSGGGYAAVDLSGPVVTEDDTNDRVKIVWDNVVFSSLGAAAGTPAALIIVHKSSGDLVSYHEGTWDVPNGNDYTVSWGASGALYAEAV